jgi:hypothetical protein
MFTTKTLSHKDLTKVEPSDHVRDSAKNNPGASFAVYFRPSPLQCILRASASLW